MMVRSLFGAFTLFHPQLLTHPGHGGKHCAEYISKTLPQILARNLTKNEHIPVAERITSSFVEVDYSITKGLRDSFKPFLTWSMPRSMRQKVIDTKLQYGDIKEIALRARSGTTALVAVIEEDYITLASVGDCRAGETFSISLAFFGTTYGT
jgi:serine/threonine protein phosphatase PrpC